MRRFQLGLAAVALPVVALTLFIVGCSKDDKKTENSSTTKEVSSESSKGDQKLTVLEPKGGVLKGKITLKGDPKIEELTKSLVAKIEDKKDQKDYCLKGSETEKTEQEYRIGDNKNLGNVFVWVKPEPGTFFKVTDQQLAALKDSKVKFRQPHCAFIPHAAFLFSQYHSNPAKPREMKPTGQVLEVTNDAEISHNTKWGGSRNKGGNETLAPKKDRIIDDLVPEESEVTVACNIHPWMSAYLRVVDTPYHAVSLSDTLDKDKVEKGDAKFGTYEIKNLPAGKVRVLAWHEKAGWLNAGEGKGETVEIAEGKETTKDFEAQAK